MLMRYALGALLVRLALAADLYATLGLTPDASDKDVRARTRSFRLRVRTAGRRARRPARARAVAGTRRPARARAGAGVMRARSAGCV